MSSLWMAAILLGATPPDVAMPPEQGGLYAAAEQPAVEQPIVEPRKGHELREAVRDALRRFARPTDKEADHAARVFIVLYQELEQDGVLAPRQREGLRQRVRGRLMDLARQIKTRRGAERRLAREKKPASVDLPERDETLGQFGGGFGGRGGGMGGFGGGMGGFGGGMGGPGMGGGVGAGGNPMVGDASQDLIDLIQKTIAPASWDVNGGPGSIYYFRPGHAMVISNTDEVHGQVGDVLDQLRRMGN